MTTLTDVTASNFYLSLTPVVYTAIDETVLIGSFFGDRLYGNAGDNIIGGLNSADVSEGFGGNDLLGGQLGNDRLFGNDGADGLIGGMGIDRLEGGAGQDSLLGGLGNDLLAGGADSDAFALYGGDGHDRVLDFDPTEDFIYFDPSAGIADDAAALAAVVDTATGAYISYAGGASVKLLGVMAADLTAANFRFAADTGAMDETLPDTNDAAIGGALGDFLRGQGGSDVIYSALGDDRIYGGDGNDFLLADVGNDLLNGGNGNDYLDGGEGNDRLITGTGLDLIEVYENDGADRVFDFTSGSDRVSVVSLGMGDFAAVTSAMVDTSNGALLQYAGGSLQFVGLAVADLASGDFVYA